MVFVFVFRGYIPTEVNCYLNKKKLKVYSCYGIHLERIQLLRHTPGCPPAEVIVIFKLKGGEQIYLFYRST